MVFDDYVWSGDALWIAIGIITPGLLIGGRGAAPAVNDYGVGGRRGGRMGMMQGISGDGIAMRKGSKGKERVGLVEVAVIIIKGV